MFKTLDTVYQHQPGTDYHPPPIRKTSSSDCGLDDVEVIGLQTILELVAVLRARDKRIDYPTSYTVSEDITVHGIWLAYMLEEMNDVRSTCHWYSN
jgi:hypothetical protein